MFSSPWITLYSRDIGRAVRFYRGIGFTETFRYAPRGQPERVDLVLDGFQLSIADATLAKANHGRSGRVNGPPIELVLRCDDADGAFDRLTAAGAKPLAQPRDQHDNLRVAWVADPDQRPIQLVQRRS